MTKATVEFKDDANPDKSVVATIVQDEEGTLTCNFKFLPDGAKSEDNSLYLALASVFLKGLGES